MQNVVNYIGSSSKIIDTIFQWSETVKDLPNELPDSLRAMAAKIEGLLQELSPAGDSPDKEFVSRLVKLMGLNGGRSPIQEHLARFLSEMHREASKTDLETLHTLRPLLDTTAKLFETIDNLQLLNQESTRQDQSFLAAFPLFWLDQRGRGEILIKRDDSASLDRPKRSYKISLLLSLSELGRLKVDVELNQKKIHGTVWTEPGEPHDAISAGLGSLAESLEAAGLKVIRLDAQVFPQTTTEPESLAVQLLPDSQGLVDIKV